MQTLETQTTVFDVNRIRADFPTLHQAIYDGRPLVYLDNAASAQKPQAVIDRLTAYYTWEHSNVHRGVHLLSQRATDAYEAARARIARFINAAHPHEVIYTRGTTEAINLVAACYGRSRLAEGDEVVISAMEHHANIVPWQMLCEEKGATLRVIPVNDRGELLVEAYDGLLNERTKLVALAHVSNSLGTINPVRRLIETAHGRDIPVLLDGAQAVQHMPVDVQALDCDFYCFSGHKIFGPTGIGILYGKEAVLDATPPYQGGGDMIETVTFEKTTYDGLPHKFEAGTPHIAGAVGLAAALEYLDEIGLDAIAAYEHDLLAYTHEHLLTIDGLRLVGTAAEKASVVSFLLEDANPYDVGKILDEQGIAVRTGHHCTMPLMQRFDIPGTVRASLALYNTRDEIDALVDGLHVARQRLSAIRQRGRDQVKAASPETPQDETPSIAERRQEIVEEFDLFDDLNDKRDFLMELGEALPSLDAAYRTEPYRIHGCLSMVWLHTEARHGCVYFQADSNAMITKGMIALLVRLLNGQPPQAILAADLNAFMAEVDIHHMISSQRKNGLGAMIKRIKLDALALAPS